MLSKILGILDCMSLKPKLVIEEVHKSTEGAILPGSCKIAVMCLCSRRQDHAVRSQREDS